MRLLNAEKAGLMKENEKLQYMMKNGHDETKQDINADLGEIFKIKFKHWLFDTVKLKQYLSNFEKNECNDIRMIEFLDENTIRKDIGIKNKLHVKLILKQVTQFKQLQTALSERLKSNDILKQYESVFNSNGILTYRDLQNDIQTEQQLENILKIRNHEKAKAIWNLLNLNDHITPILKTNEEGQSTEYIQ